MTTGKFLRSFAKPVKVCSVIEVFSLYIAEVLVPDSVVPFVNMSLNIVYLFYFASYVYISVMWVQKQNVKNKNRADCALEAEQSHAELTDLTRFSQPLR